jgi:hypothetical protein
MFLLGYFWMRVSAFESVNQVNRLLSPVWVSIIQCVEDRTEQKDRGREKSLYVPDCLDWYSNLLVLKPSVSDRDFYH